MRPGVKSCVTVPQAIVDGLRSGQDPHNVSSRLSHERKKNCDSLCTEATIDGLILLRRDYPVAIVSIICLCRPIVNGLNKVAESVLVCGLSFWSCYQASFSVQYGCRISSRSDWEISCRDQIR
jgi:hypothetical protein